MGSGSSLWLAGTGCGSLPRLQFPDSEVNVIPDQAAVGKEHKWSLSTYVCLCVCVCVCVRVRVHAPSCSVL